MNIFIFTPGDTDGLFAGAIVFAANPGAQVFFTNPYRLLEDLSVARDSDTVIICDLSISETHLTQLVEKFSYLA